MSCLLLHLGGCAGKQPALPAEVSSEAGAQIVRSETPIVDIDGRTYSEPLYRHVDLAPGHHRISTDFVTTFSRYRCTFAVDFEAGQTYQIIRRPDTWPVVLYQIKKGPIFTRRLQKFAPQDCVKIE